jgi:hypothetical protein
MLKQKNRNRMRKRLGAWGFALVVSNNIKERRGFNGENVTNGIFK